MGGTSTNSGLTIGPEITSIHGIIPSGPGGPRGFNEASPVRDRSIEQPKRDGARPQRDMSAPHGVGQG